MKSNFFKYHFPFIFWMAIIFIQSSFPSIELPKVDFINADKLIHVGVYGLLAVLCYVSLVHVSKVNTFSSNPLLWTIIITSIYGATDELHQYFVPNRSSDIVDWVADTIGAIIAVLIIKYFLQNKYILFKRSLV